MCGARPCGGSAPLCQHTRRRATRIAYVSYESPSVRTFARRGNAVASPTFMHCAPQSLRAIPAGSNRTVPRTDCDRHRLVVAVSTRPPHRFPKTAIVTRPHVSSMCAGSHGACRARRNPNPCANRGARHPRAASARLERRGRRARSESLRRRNGELLREPTQRPPSGRDVRPALARGPPPRPARRLAHLFTPSVLRHRASPSFADRVHARFVSRRTMRSPVNCTMVTSAIRITITVVITVVSKR
ncbi:hypothetical protein DM82_4322 [Burkholderia oklahomensis]|uniref:Uncharacterized protein n=1 Tax=Burkholderia oklahomensis TaxID=342113 RepID=A0AAI8FRS1_9BURK|nr:hypothetical protein DM82_4322 [Burkholderia oklahomensis]